MTTPERVRHKMVAYIYR